MGFFRKRFTIKGKSISYKPGTVTFSWLIDVFPVPFASISFPRTLHFLPSPVAVPQSSLPSPLNCVHGDMWLGGGALAWSGLVVAHCLHLGWHLHSSFVYLGDRAPAITDWVRRISVLRWCELQLTTLCGITSCVAWSRALSPRPLAVPHALLIRCHQGLTCQWWRKSYRQAKAPKHQPGLSNKQLMRWDNEKLTCQLGAWKSSSKQGHYLDSHGRNANAEKNPGPVWNASKAVQPKSLSWWWEVGNSLIFQRPKD